MQNGQKIVDEVKHDASSKKLNVQTELLGACRLDNKSDCRILGKNNVSLIVFGTSGIFGIMRMLLGSTASGVITYSH